MRRLVHLGALIIAFGITSAHAGLISVTPGLGDGAVFSGGGDICTSSGSYDADTLVWQQTFKHTYCDETFWPGEDQPQGDIEALSIDSMEMSAAGLVDNSGNALGGAFSWSGAIPELGIDEVTLLGTGTVVDVWYGRVEELGMIPGVAAFIRLDFLIDPLEEAGFGPVLEWFSYVGVEEWDPPFGDSNCPSSELCPWESSASYSGGYTGSSFWSYDRAVVVPEPDTLGLFVLGLAALGFIRRSGRVSRLKGRTR